MSSSSACTQKELETAFNAHLSAFLKYFVQHYDAVFVAAVHYLHTIDPGQSNAVLKMSDPDAAVKQWMQRIVISPMRPMAAVLFYEFLSKNPTVFADVWAILFPSSNMPVHTASSGSTAATSGAHGTSGASGSSTSSTSSNRVFTRSEVTFERVNPPATKTILVGVAKDHEWRYATAIADNVGWNKVNRGTVGSGDAMRYIEYSHNGSRIVFAAAYTMGQPAVDKYRQLISTFKPTHVTTVGCCAGRAEDTPSRHAGVVATVYLITEAIVEDTSEVLFVQAHAAATDAWRQYEKVKRVRLVGRAGDAHDRLQATRVLSTVGNAATDNEAQVAALLTEYQARCLDMEIAHLWSVVAEDNIGKTQANCTMLLPAVKGFSDSGNGHDRDANIQNAVEYATRFVAAMINRLVDDGRR
eukprot:ANDGO_08453.mRNA.1 hypothetical protein